MVNISKLAVSDISDSVSEHNVHDEYKTLTIQERRTVCDRESYPYEVAVINVTGELNVGNIIRSASLCGARKVHILGRRKYDKRGTVGAENYIEVVRENFILDDDPLELDIVGIVNYFQVNKLFPIFVEQYDDIRVNYEPHIVTDVLNYGQTPVFVFGNENRGIPKQLIDSFYGAPVVYQLHQRGVLRSFNVGSAAAIILYDVLQSFLYGHIQHV
jgi:tRNA G18 (ribose-2'-O)-methylase SpoU